jgi:uncharacterized protein
MIFDVDAIPDAGLVFNIKVSKKDFDIDQPGCSLAGEVNVQGTLGRIDRDVYFDGKIDTELNVLCSRCLEPFRHLVKSKVTAHYVPKPSPESSAAELELHEGDIDVEYFEENRIDLRKPVQDQILLTVPLVSLCREDCKGLCVVCGKNLNEGPCGCKKDDEIDPRLKILQSLKNKLE